MGLHRVVIATAAGASLLMMFACDRAKPNKAQDGGHATSTTSWRDNADGTVTDVATGLVWEKKCNCPGTPHHYETMYFWSADGEHETIWDWLDALNKEGEHGFAGHSDWRIPNVKELVSLVDYQRSDPAVSPPFDECEGPCSDASGASCSCTAWGSYWTSTTFADFPAHAFVVGFALGGADDQLKTLPGFVRAVRGPLTATAQRAGPQASAQPSR